MKAAAILLLLSGSPVMADQMTAVGCDALSQAAERSADRLEETTGEMKVQGFRDAVPHMPPSSQGPANAVESAEAEAEKAIGAYAAALREFSAAIKDCGN